METVEQVEIIRLPADEALTGSDWQRLLHLKQSWPRERVLAEAQGLDLKRLQFVSWLVHTARVSDGLPAGAQTNKLAA